MKHIALFGLVLISGSLWTSIAVAQQPQQPWRPGMPDPRKTPPPPPEEPPPPPPPEPDESVLGGPGESCRARPDCRRGLACLENVCRDEREGETCGSTADCGGELRCVTQKCVRQGTATVEPPPDVDCGPTALDNWLDFELSGMHPFLGMSWAGGPTFFDFDGNGLTYGSFSYAIRGGVMIDKLELGLEVSPLTHLPATDYIDGTFQAHAFVGYHVPITGNVHWPLRFGAGIVAANLPLERVWMQVRADLIGLSFLVGHMMIEVHLPSFRYATDFQDVHGLSWFPGLSTSYVF